MEISYNNTCTISSKGGRNEMTVNQGAQQEQNPMQDPQGDQIPLQVVIEKLGQRIGVLNQANIVQEILLEQKDKKIAELEHLLSLKGGDK